jgi:phenylalanyl-tRNA synthetase beta chain
MIVNTGWLLDYLSPKVALADLLTALPRVGLDVEATHILERELAPVRIGFIRSKRPLEGTTDKFVCEVEVARGEVRTIVAASAHPLEAGWGVPVALAGTELPTGATIHEDHFHGVLSQGMICLDGELGMAVPFTNGGSGLQVFHDEALLGKSLPDVIPISEALVHMKVYPNRPDCLGLIGIARELAALLDLKLVPPEAPQPVSFSDAVIPVKIADRALCTRYTCQVISGVRVEKSAAWLASRLLATGSRPINNVVDITNFVMKEWGQPLHAFDLANVRQRIVVRRFKKGESLRLLDGRVVNASGGDSDFAASDHAPLAVADAKAPMALAGIMGGEFSGISDETVDVLLEAAHFEPTNIRMTSRRLGVSSDSSYRFERGLDPNETLEGGRNRATALLFSDAHAQTAGAVTDVYPKRAKRTVFSLSERRVSGYLGIPVTRGQVHQSLTRLGYECSADLKRIHVPTRRVDANDPVVLIEDVARVIGYEAIPSTPTPETPSAGATTALDAARETVRGVLTGSGFLELRGVPLEPLEGAADFSLIEGESVVLQNPLNEDLARLRRSLVPFQLKTAALNARRRATTFRTFETDKIFSRTGVGADGAEADEHWAVGLLLGGAANDADWSTRRASDFFDLKGMVESVLEALRVPRPLLEPAVIEGYAAGTAARLTIDGQTVGAIGQISPELLAARKIQAAVFAAELFLGRLLAVARPLAQYAPLPRFPGVFRDLSFVVGKDVAYAAIEQAIREAAGTHLESVDCIDVFAGKGIAGDRRSIAVSMAFRAPDRTLSSEEVTAAVDQVIAHLAQDFRAELRGS